MSPADGGMMVPVAKKKKPDWFEAEDEENDDTPPFRNPIPDITLRELFNELTQLRNRTLQNPDPFMMKAEQALGIFAQLIRIQSEAGVDEIAQMRTRTGKKRLFTNAQMPPMFPTTDKEAGNWFQRVTCSELPTQDRLKKCWEIHWFLKHGCRRDWLIDLTDKTGPIRAYELIGQALDEWKRGFDNEDDRRNFGKSLLVKLGVDKKKAYAFFWGAMDADATRKSKRK